MTKKLADWDYVYAVAKHKAAQIGADHGDFPQSPEKLREAMDWPEYMALKPFMGRMREIGVTYQEMLCALMVISPAEVVVETGVRTGISTRFLMAGIPTELHSVDPMYVSQQKALDGLLAAVEGAPVPDERWTFWPGRSVDRLLEIAIKTGGWDLFLHDGDHRLEPQTLDLEMGWAFLRPGGMLVCDDWDFPFPNGNSHGAFATFCKRRGLEFNTIGGAAVVVKPPASEDKVTSIATPEQLFQAAVSVAVADQWKFDGGTIPAYAGYIKEGK